MAASSLSRRIPTRSTLAAGARWLGSAAFLITAGCTADGMVLGPMGQQPADQPVGEPAEPAPVEGDYLALEGENLGGKNLVGSNLVGSNLQGSNLGGPNMGGSNLQGSNLVGSNFGGTNFGGNNLGANNMAATNLAASNLAGKNLQGSNLQGSNLQGSNLQGSNLVGSNLQGNNLVGSNLQGSNLQGSNSGVNIHNLASSQGMLYSAEDLWLPKTGQCIVLGIGSTAFAKLLGQQSVNAKISVALGKLPWGFAKTSGGSLTLSAWEAVVWGDKTYCSFVMVTPPDTTWPLTAGFIKAVFRWNAPPGQTMEISGIEASSTVDPTVTSSIISYTGMMDAASRWRSGAITEKAFIAGEMAFVSATTNNTSVMVDFASWVQDKNKNPLILGNVTDTNKPTYAEALYIALDNGDGTVQILLDDAASRAKVIPAGMVNSVADLNAAYLGYQQGLGPKPKPRRCGGALYLKTWFNEPVEAGKCDDGLVWAPGFCTKNADSWTRNGGGVGPMNDYMTVNKKGADYQRGLISGSSCGTMKTVLSETYIHMWEPNFDIPYSASCVYEGNASFCARRSKNCGSVVGTDNCGAARTVTCGSCNSPATCGGSGVPNVCGVTTSLIFEAEDLGNDLNGKTYAHACAEMYNKVLGNPDPPIAPGTCAGGYRLRYLGESTSNTTYFNNVNVPTAGTYTLTVYAGTRDQRKFYLSVNGGSAKTITMDGTDFGTMVTASTTITLNAGNNKLKFYNDSAPTPDLDRIKVTLVSGVSCTAESNASFCARQGRNCGSVTGVDNCGNSRTVSSCGSCASGQTCGGGGFPNICGTSGSGGTGGACATAYSQSSCQTYSIGTVVSFGGKNWTCVGGNCANCANVAGCAPGGTDCPWGEVWDDTGTCGSGGGGGSTCATAYANSACLTYYAGKVVSRNGHNWTCSNGNCMNCANYTTCEPGSSGCPWGTVWTDSGTCN